MKKNGYLLKISEVSKAFKQPSGEDLNVLINASLDIAIKNIVALMGPNGCGKSTLLNIISGNIVPDNGEIILNGNNITALPAFKRAQIIGRVHQESYKSLASLLTVSEILSISMRRGKNLLLSFASSETTIQKIGEYSAELAMFLSTREDVPTRVLSGGQRQLLALAIAVLGTPKLLLLDEHMASLDEQYKGIADKLLETYINKNDASVIVVTHDYRWATSMSNAIATYEMGTFKLMSSNKSIE